MKKDINQLYEDYSNLIEQDTGLMDDRTQKKLEKKIDMAYIKLADACILIGVTPTEFIDTKLREAKKI